MNTAGLNIDRIKKNVIEYWQAEAWNWPVKVISAQRAPQSVSRGQVVPVRGYVTAQKFVLGRNLSEVEKILGLIPGDLQKGAVLLRLSRLPGSDEFDLRGYTQTPAGIPYVGGLYPPGLGAAQWELTVDIPAVVMKIAPAGQRL